MKKVIVSETIEKSMYRCSVCGETFIDEDDTKRHEASCLGLTFDKYLKYMNLRDRLDNLIDKDIKRIEKSVMILKPCFLN